MVPLTGRPSYNSTLLKSLVEMATGAFCPLASMPDSDAAVALASMT